MRKPGAKALVIYNQKILMILRDNIPTIPYPNTWNLPGGGIEENESGFDAMERELEEEICITPKKIINLGRQTFEDGSFVERFLVILSDDEYKNVRLGDEGQKLDFFSLDEVLNLQLSPELKGYLLKYKKIIQSLIESDVNFSAEDLVPLFGKL